MTDFFAEPIITMHPERKSVMVIMRIRFQSEQDLQTYLDGCEIPAQSV